MRQEKQQEPEESIQGGGASPGTNPGIQLRRLREQRGLSLSAVAQETRIPVKFLQALEMGESAPFPARSYFRGFLESYCGFLGADFETFWREFQAEEEARQKARAPEPEPRPARPSPAPAAAGAAILAAAILAGTGLFYASRRRDTQTPRESPAAPFPELRPPKKAPPSAADFVSIAFAKDLWVSLNVDGSPYFDGRVPPGALKKISVRQVLILKTSSPQDIAVTANGRSVPLPPPAPDGSYTLRRNGLLP